MCNLVFCADAGFMKPSKLIQDLEPKPSNTSQRIYSGFKQVVDLWSYGQDSGRSVLQWYEGCQC